MKIDRGSWRIRIITLREYLSFGCLINTWYITRREEDKEKQIVRVEVSSVLIIRTSYLSLWQRGFVFVWFPVGGPLSEKEQRLEYNDLEQRILRYAKQTMHSVG